MRGYNGFVLNLVTELDGIKALLFHVEQQTDVPIQIRWRFAGCSWREEWVSSFPFLIPAEIPGAALEVEHRLSADDEWSQAALHRFLRGTALFELTAPPESHFALAAGEPLMLVAPSSCGQDCSCFVMEPLPTPLLIPAGESIAISATAASPSYWNRLPKPEVFLVEHGPLLVRNITATRDDMEPSSAPPILSAMADNPPFVCAIRRARRPTTPSI